MRALGAKQGGMASGKEFTSRLNNDLSTFSLFAFKRAAYFQCDHERTSGHVAASVTMQLTMLKSANGRGLWAYGVIFGFTAPFAERRGNAF
uniref:Uncharacterized protein n=1 Tax=Rhipicephalus zambeziensis TaxID=60191 RepID=A0A224YD05_9ACAR